MVPFLAVLFTSKMDHDHADCWVGPDFCCRVTYSTDREVRFLTFMRSTPSETVTIPIPTGVTVRNRVRGIDVQPRHDEFAIASGAEYVVMRNDEGLFRLIDERTCRIPYHKISPES